MSEKPFVNFRCVQTTSAGKATAILGVLLILASLASADSGCQTGAGAVADAYIVSNCMYSLYFESIESYLGRNRVHFTADGDAIRCARSLSRALVQGAIQQYDPEALNRQEALRAQMGAMGVSPGPYQPTASAQFLAMGRQMSWLADVLPAAAAGNFTPMQTPQTEEQQLQMFACQMLHSMLQDPMLADAMAQIEPLVREYATLEHQMIVAMARGLP